MDSFALRVIAPTGVIFEGRVEQVTATNSLGEFGVLAQHVDFMSALTACPLIIKPENGDFRYFVVPSGLAEIKDGAMTILVPNATPAQELESAKAGEEMSELRRKLESLESGSEEYAEAERALSWAQARWRASQLVRSPSERL